MTKIPNFENSRWRSAAIWKWFYRYNSAGIIRFQRNLVCSRKLRFQRRSHDEVPQFCKFNISDGRHNENRFFFGYIWTIYCPINANFRTKKHNYTQTQITWPKYSGSRHLNRDNKTANINVKNCSLSTTYNANWYIENSKNNERWYYFRSTLTPAKCF